MNVDERTTGERWLRFEGAANFRDLGGYATADGGTTRWGTVYRSDGLHGLTAKDIEHYADLGVRVVYDLRRDSEREQRPNRVPSLGLCIATPAHEAGWTPADRLSLTDQRGGEDFLRTMYSEMLSHSGTVIGEVLTGLTQPGGVPAVFHCHAGKDRTGIVAALLLEALQVDRETVLDDYELTAAAEGHDSHGTTFNDLVTGGMAAEAAAGMLGAPRWAMADTLTQLDEQFGGIEAYLLGPAGLDADTLTQLRQRLVEY
jgi:protein-tyrosine phosphatase